MKRHKKLLVGLLVSGFVVSMLGTTDYPSAKRESDVYAQSAGAEYRYDALGRVKSVTYSNGVMIMYEYDANGNILSTSKTVEPKTTEGKTQSSSSEETGKQTAEQRTDAPGGQTTEQTTDAPGSQTTEKTTDSAMNESTQQATEISGRQSSEQITDSETAQSTDLSEKQSSQYYPNEQENIGERQAPNEIDPILMPGTPEVIPDLRYSPEETKQYNKFKTKKLIIKSIKRIKGKKSDNLKIQIKQIAKRGTYGEIGYQIKFATNKKFKKAKVVVCVRGKRGSVTSKQWKIQKKKTYYVKARAYLKTRTGKTIYSKYSKVWVIKNKKKTGK